MSIVEITKGVQKALIKAADIGLSLATALLIYNLYSKTEVTSSMIDTIWYTCLTIYAFVLIPKYLCKWCKKQ